MMIVGSALAIQCREDALGSVTDPVVEVAMCQRVQLIGSTAARMLSAAIYGSITVAIPA